MSRTFSLILFVPIYFLSMCLIIFMQTQDLIRQKLDDNILKSSVNYAVDCAVDEMLETGDLGMDYANWGKFKLDPEIAVEAFVNNFCLNYNLPLTKENKQLVKNQYIKVFTVCTYDGYYMYESRPVNSQDWELVSTPKLPYSMKEGDSYYALNLGLDSYWRFQNGSLSKVKATIDKNTQLAKINERVSDDLMSRVDKHYSNGFSSTVYIPYNMTTIKPTNAINRPTVLALVDDVDIIHSKNTQVFGIGGAHVSNTRQVAGYIRNGQKYYCYSDLLPKDKFTATNPDGTKTFIQEMFSSPTEAAEAGYHHDTLYMN